MQWDTTDTDGRYLFNEIPIGATVQLSCKKSDSPLKGLTAFDLALIQQAILGINPLTHDYQYIAGDPDFNQIILPQDVSLIRRLILEIDSQFAHGLTWVFIPINFNSSQQLSLGKVDYTTTQNLQVEGININQDWMAVKLGDLNNSALSTSVNAQ